MLLSNQYQIIFMPKKHQFPSVFSFLVCFLILSACARNPVTGKREISLVSTEQEVAMGQEADPQIIAQFGLYEDERLQNFINAKGQQMARISHRPELDYKFRIVDSPILNAFAVPGGYVYFTRGIMAHFNNEAEFAGVLGHEIGHITARHSVQQQTKATLAQVLMVGGMVVSPEFAQFGDLVGQGVGLLFLKYGRDDERQSDRLGVEYSTKIGYDAKEMADFFETLERSSAQAGATEIPNFLSTHPSPAERQETVAALAAEWKAALPQDNYEVGRESYLSMIDGMVYGADPKQGFFEDNMFYHPVLKFKFGVPMGWTKINSPQAVQMAPKEGGAAMIFTLAQGDNLQAAAQQVVDKYQLQVIESEETTVNGLPAIAFVAEQPAQQQGAAGVRVLNYLIQYDGNIYSILGASDANNFSNYASTFNEVAKSFNRLTDPEKLNREPMRIDIVRVSRTASLEQVLVQNGVSRDMLQEVAILNGMPLNTQLESGRSIKVIR